METEMKEECERMIEESEDVADVAVVRIREVQAELRVVISKMDELRNRMLEAGSKEESSPLYSDYLDLTERVEGLDGMVEQLDGIEDNYFY